MEENKEKKPENSLIIYILLFALILCLIAVLGSIRQQDNMDLYAERDLTATAGITYYMSALEKACMDGAEPDMDYIEAVVTPVAASMESDIPETEEEQEEETDGREALVDYFGYIPTDDEITLWQRVVMAECGNTEPDAGVAAVADVIANRVLSERFPSDITGVVYQRGQFQTVSNGAIWRYEVSDRVAEICSDQISEGRTYDYLFFTAGSYNPYCTPGEVIGNHYFGY